MKNHMTKRAGLLAALAFAPLMALSACDTMAPGGADAGGSASAGAGWVYPSLGRERPLVIGHRGASGDVPEHTLESYQRALNDGADCIEPDLVMTKDNVLVARHDLYLSTTTNVASKPEFASRKRKTDDAAYEGRTDWWVEDFTLAEIKSLRAVQPFAGRTKVFDGLYQIPTFDEVLMIGTVMLVSHDRALLREVCDEFWLVSGGQVQPFDGDLDDYQRWLLEVSRAIAKGQQAPAWQTPRAAPPPPPPKAAAAPSRDERKADKQQRARRAATTRPLRIELQQLDARLARLAQEKAEVEAALSATGAVPEDYAELGRRLAHIGAETHLLEERWLELQAEIEALDAGSS